MPLDIECRKCGHARTVYYDEMIRGSWCRCPICQPDQIVQHERLGAAGRSDERTTHSDSETDAA